MSGEVFEEIDEFCKSEFGDNRWTMIHTLIKGQKEDYKFAMLYEMITDLKEQVAEINFTLKKPQEESEEVKTFGRKVE